MAATVATSLMAFVFAAVAFSAGAATGNRSMAVSLSSALAGAGFIVEGLGPQVKLLRPLREISPWYWLLHSEPLHHGLVWQASVLPLAVSIALVAASTVFLVRRDLASYFPLKNSPPSKLVLRESGCSPGPPRPTPRPSRGAGSDSDAG